MKINKIIALLALIIVASCQPIEDRAELTNSFNPDDIIVEAIQKSPGSNEISLYMKSPGVSGYWDYNTGKSLTNEATFSYPALGKMTFNFVISSQYIESDGSTEFVSKGIEVTIDKFTVPANPIYATIAGDGSEGKTWVFDGTVGDGGKWWFSCGADRTTFNLDNLGSHSWWNAGGGGFAFDDSAGKMVFKGAAGYSHYETLDAEPTNGRFSFSTDFKYFTFVDAPILGNNYGTPNGTYEIVQLTDDKLVLYNPRVGTEGNGWMWIFKSI